MQARAMEADDNFIYLGKIVKAHGTKGEVVIALEQPDVAGFESETLFIKNYAGDFVPHKADSVVLRKKSSRYSFFVKFARIDSRTESEKMVGCEVYTFDDSQADPEQETEPAALTGCNVFDEQGKALGKIVHEMHTQAHPLIEIDLNGNNLMVPFVDEYIVEHIPGENKVIVKNLDRFSE